MNVQGINITIGKGGAVSVLEFLEDLLQEELGAAVVTIREDLSTTGSEIEVITEATQH